jgi:hypothetical protein
MAGFLTSRRRNISQEYHLNYSKKILSANSWYNCIYKPQVLLKWFRGIIQSRNVFSQITEASYVHHKFRINFLTRERITNGKAKPFFWLVMNKTRESVKGREERQIAIGWFNQGKRDAIILEDRFTYFNYLPILFYPSDFPLLTALV